MSTSFRILIFVFIFLFLFITYVTWLNNSGKIPTGTGVTPTITPAPISRDNELSISVCDPNNGPFSTNITNEYFPLPLTLHHIIEGDGSKVEFTVLNQTEIVAGVTARVFQEREWSDGTLVEISRNFAVQAPDGTVCYYGEDVDIYENGAITSHDGAWRAGIGQNQPGILMPAHPSLNQAYFQEFAPGIAQDRASHLSIGGTYTTPAGVFNDVLKVEETPPSTKRYAKGIGMIYDDGAVLTSY